MGNALRRTGDLEHCSTAQLEEKLISNMAAKNSSDKQRKDKEVHFGKQSGNTRRQPRRGSGPSRSTLYRHKRNTRLFPALEKDWNSLEKNYDPVVPANFAEDARFEVAKAFRVIFSEDGSATDTPGESRKQLERFAKSLDRLLFNYQKIGPQCRKHVDVTFEGVTEDDDFPLARILGRLIQEHDNLPIWFDEASRAALGGNGGQTIDIRIRRLASLLVEIYRKGPMRCSPHGETRTAAPVPHRCVLPITRWITSFPNSKYPNRHCSTKSAKTSGGLTIPDAGGDV